MTLLRDRALSLSIGLHLGFALPIALLVVIRPQLSPKKLKPVPVTIIEAPAEIKEEQPKAIQLSKPPPEPAVKPKEPPPQPVFGLSRDTLKDDSGRSNVEIKKGNTIAKEVDSIATDDDRALPVPTDEYLVTSMPRIKREVRPEYTTEARKARIEGPVVMDILIDRNGKVVKVELVSGLGYGLDEAAVQAMKSFEFEPARVQNEAVAVKIRYTYRFELRG